MIIFKADEIIGHFLNELLSFGLKKCEKNGKNKCQIVFLEDEDNFLKSTTKIRPVSCLGR